MYCIGTDCRVIPSFKHNLNTLYKIIVTTTPWSTYFLDLRFRAGDGAAGLGADSGGD